MKVESKISKRIESREFVNELDNIQLTATNVELGNGFIQKIGNGLIRTKTNNKADRIVGDFVIGGNLFSDMDDRILALNIKYRNFKDVVQPLLEFLNKIESNEFEDVEEFEYEKAARLEAEAQQPDFEPTDTTAPVPEDEIVDNIVPVM